MARRAFSIIELLVVLALVVALTSVAMPALVGRVGSAALEAAARQVGAAVDAARSESQRLGRPVRLEGRAQAGGATGLWVVPTGAAAAGEELDASAPAAELWGELPEGVRLSASLAPEAAAPVEVEPAAEPTAVATILPDGNVAAAGPLFVVSDAGALRVRIHGWTGAVTFEPARPGEEALGGSENEDEEALLEEPPVIPEDLLETGGEP